MNLTEHITSALTRLDWNVVDELHHIPRGKRGSLQEALRLEYAGYRMAHRAAKAALSPKAALAQAVFNLRRWTPEFQPRYDAGFFFEGSHMSRTLACDPLAVQIEAMAASGGHGNPNGIETGCPDKRAMDRRPTEVATRSAMSLAG